MRAVAAFCALVFVIAVPLGLAGSHPNSSPITVVDNAPAAPYPSTIDVTGEASNLDKVTVDLNGVGHTFPDDLDVLLVSPTGSNAILMSDTCGQNPAALVVSLTFDDAALMALPDTSVIGCPPTPPSTDRGTYQPTNIGVGDVWPDPAPVPSGNTALNIFNGKNPNGIWKLFVVDDEAQDQGTIAQGWVLNITSSGATAVAVREFHARNGSGGVVLRWRTASEVNLAGFNVYRSSGREQFRLNRRVVPARSAAGSSYALVDRNVRRGSSYTYRLQVVNLDGSRAWHGSSSLVAR